MVKRGLFSDKERTLIRKVEQEHMVFQYRMLSLPNRKIYDQCHQIYFYECLYEYFQYKEEIPKEIVKTCSSLPDILSEAWEVYLECEYFHADTWEGIEEILQRLTERHI